MSSLKTKALNTIRKYRMIRPDEKIIVQLTQRDERVEDPSPEEL